MKKRLTPIKMVSSHPPIEVDYDRLLSDMNDCSAMEYVKSLSDPFYWLVALPHLDTSCEIRERFFSAFTAEGKKEERMKTYLGNNRAGKEDEAHLLNMAMGESGKIDSSDDAAVESRMQNLSVIGLLFVQIVTNGEHEKLANMSEALKHKKIPAGNRGGIESEGGRLFIAFCECHKKSGQLSTKKEVRLQAGVLEDNYLINDANKCLRKLGLGGLPPS